AIGRVAVLVGDAHGGLDGHIRAVYGALAVTGAQTQLGGRTRDRGSTEGTEQLVGRDDARLQALRLPGSRAEGPMVEGVAVLVGARDVDGRMATPARHLPPDVEAPRWPPAGIDRLHDERERKSRPD